MMLEPLGEVGANFSLQLSSRKQFTKINNKKIIAKNQCEKHKKSSLVPYWTKENLHQSHQPAHGIDDHGKCMTNLPVHLICNMTTFRRRKCSDL